MVRIKLIMLAVLAVFAVSAVAAATASATRGEGEIVNSSGNKLVKNHFTGTSGETELRGATTIKCKHATAAGVITSTTGGELTATFTGCAASGLSCKGQNVGGKALAAGEVVVLGGLLVKGAIGRTEDVILAAIIPQESKGAAEVTMTCSGVAVRIRGSFLSQPIPLEKVAKDYTLFAKATGNAQEPLEYENEKNEKVKNTLESSLNEGAFQQSAEVGSGIVLFEETVQLL